MANDQGMMYGYATSETQEFLPLSVVVAHKLMKLYEQFRLEHNKQYFADAKSQVSVQYDNDKIEKIATVLVSVSHADFVEHSQIEQQIKQNVIDVVLAQYSQYVQDDLQIIINPSGKFTVWGSYSDSGCVGRKIVVDTYGGIGRVGGGCFSSKNATKVDRSGAYFARYVAKNIVANNFASKCEVALSFAIGQEKPLNLNIDCFGTNTLPMEQIYKIVENNFNFDLSSIIKTLDLLKPIYKQTACYGHFGNNAYPWEKVITLQIQ
jgi:S-adenosylmethionine synthetase